MTLALSQPKEVRKQDFELLLHSPHSVLRNCFVALGTQSVQGLTDPPAFASAGSFGVPLRESVHGFALKSMDSIIHLGGAFFPSLYFTVNFLIN